MIKKTILALAALLLAATAFAQNKTSSGKVSDENGEPLIWMWYDDWKKEFG